MILSIFSNFSLIILLFISLFNGEKIQEEKEVVLTNVDVQISKISHHAHRQNEKKLWLFEQEIENSIANQITKKNESATSITISMNFMFFDIAIFASFLFLAFCKKLELIKNINMQLWHWKHLLKIFLVIMLTVYTESLYRNYEFSDKHVFEVRIHIVYLMVAALANLKFSSIIKSCIGIHIASVSFDKNRRFGDSYVTVAGAIVFAIMIVIQIIKFRNLNKNESSIERQEKSLKIY